MFADVEITELLADNPPRITVTKDEHSQGTGKPQTQTQSEKDSENVVQPLKKLGNATPNQNENVNLILLSLTKKIKLLRSEAANNTIKLEKRIATAQESNLSAISGLKEELENIETAWDSNRQELQSKQLVLEAEIATSPEIARKS
ncbi:hypothetical protein KQX54_013786 [Cotesia glomerata]|uniref:Uncharacterized protein n=1 Tax=Cotesia glomerata TaxID=32391 RepID=A0AAV7HJH0_COTGL|nr:hypothetical protein KQX54_013786 [Cotesia glomerata]